MWLIILPSFVYAYGQLPGLLQAEPTKRYFMQCTAVHPPQHAANARGCHKLQHCVLLPRLCLLLVEAMSEADKKALKVKAGVVKRLAKEMAMYEQEVAAEQTKVQRLKDSGADTHDIKYAVSIAGERCSESVAARCRC